VLRRKTFHLHGSTNRRETVSKGENTVTSVLIMAGYVLLVQHRCLPVDERGNHLERNSPKTLSQETFSQETKESILKGTYFVKLLSEQF
jgi:hypothetical protein